MNTLQGERRRKAIRQAFLDGEESLADYLPVHDFVDDLIPILLDNLNQLPEELGEIVEKWIENAIDNFIENDIDYHID